jgi:hypothetical protein
VSVVESGYQTRFPVEPFPKGRITRKLAWQDLHGHGPVQSRIAGAIDFAHPSGADERRTLICDSARRQVEGRRVDEGHFPIGRQERLDFLLQHGIIRAYLAHIRVPLLARSGQRLVIDRRHSLPTVRRHRMRSFVVSTSACSASSGPP